MLYTSTAREAQSPPSGKADRLDGLAVEINAILPKGVTQQPSVTLANEGEIVGHLHKWRHVHALRRLDSIQEELAFWASAKITAELAVEDREYLDQYIERLRRKLEGVPYEQVRAQTRERVRRYRERKRGGG